MSPACATTSAPRHAPSGSLALTSPGAQCCRASLIRSVQSTLVLQYVRNFFGVNTIYLVIFLSTAGERVEAISDLDEIDRKLLKLLQEDGRTSVVDNGKGVR